MNFGGGPMPQTARAIKCGLAKADGIGLNPKARKADAGPDWSMAPQPLTKREIEYYIVLMERNYKSSCAATPSALDCSPREAVRRTISGA
jgi:hypothetical protein